MMMIDEVDPINTNQSLSLTDEESKILVNISGERTSYFSDWKNSGGLKYGSKRQHNNSVK